jgi:hypothetical protein
MWKLRTGIPRTVFFIHFILLSLVSIISAQNNQILLSAGDEAFDLVRAIAYSRGILPLSLDAPQTLDKVLRAADEGNPTDSLAEVKALEWLASIRQGTGIPALVPLSIAYEASISPEVYLSRADSTIQAVFGLGERSSLVSVPFDLGINDALALGADVSLGLNPDTLNKALCPDAWSNIASQLGYYDFRIPLFSYLSAGGDFWNLRVGRAPIDYGPAAENIYLSESAGYLDHVYGEIFFNDFSYSALAASLDSRQEGGKSWQIPQTYSDVPRTLLVHRLQARFIDKIRLALTEGTMIGGVLPDLRYLNPLSIFHDFYDFQHSTAYVGVEIEALPWKYVSLYASGVANQLQSSYEKARYPGSEVIPDAFAWQAGSRAFIPLGPGFLEARAEYSYANPWMYIREYPSISYSNEHYLCSNVPGSSQYDFPSLGFSNGPDSILSLIEVGYRAPGRVSGLLGLEYLQKGEHSLETPYTESLEAALLISPSGIPENNLAMRAEAKSKAIPGLGLRLGGALIFVSNQGHVQGASDWDFQGIATLEVDAFALYRFLSDRDELASH